MKAKASFIVYIDESGDEGFVFKEAYQGSSHWFILSAVIVRKSSDLQVVKLVDQVRTQLAKRPHTPIHFRNIKHEHRLVFVQQISQAQLRILTVLVHKPSITEPEIFRERYRLYFYAARYLLERICWFCRDHRTTQDEGDGSADIVFSNRAGMSYKDLRRYFQLLKTLGDSGQVRIDWSIIEPDRQVHAFSHDKLMGLQIADAAASAFFFGVQTTAHGFTEPRYAQMLKP